MNFKNAWIYTENFQFEKGAFSIENGRFVDVLGKEKEDAVDLNGLKVIPGLLDVHTHGNSGWDFSDGSYEGLVTMARYEAKSGVTTFAPTSLTMPYDVLHSAFQTAVKINQEKPQGCASVRGIHMEGPFFAEAKKGAQNADYLKLPDYEAFQKLNDDCGHLIKIADVAPELPGALDFIKKASKDCTVSIAHTDTGYEDAKAGIEAGATHMTHLFNAMNPIHHRKPGPIIAASEEEQVFAEIIGDGLHVHPAIIRMAFRLFGAERMILISDSLRCCGLPDGEYDIGGQKAILKEGVARLTDGTIAGSATNVFECMRRVMSFGVPECEALRAATYNPAKQLGCLSEVGSISNGKCADFVICDNDYQIQQVFINGQEI